MKKNYIFIFSILFLSLVFFNCASESDADEDTITINISSDVGNTYVEGDITSLGESYIEPPVTFTVSANPGTCASSRTFSNIEVDYTVAVDESCTIEGYPTE